MLYTLAACIQTIVFTQCSHVRSWILIRHFDCKFQFYINTFISFLSTFLKAMKRTLVAMILENFWHHCNNKVSLDCYLGRKYTLYLNIGHTDIMLKRIFSELYCSEYCVKIDELSPSCFRFKFYNLYALMYNCFGFECDTIQSCSYSKQSQH